MISRHITLISIFTNMDRDHCICTQCSEGLLASPSNGKWIENISYHQWNCIFCVLFLFWYYYLFFFSCFLVTESRSHYFETTAVTKPWPLSFCILCASLHCFCNVYTLPLNGNLYRSPHTYRIPQFYRRFKSFVVGCFVSITRCGV